ncbi:hypothetical protein SAMN05443637_115125 [Pseudonocardia thermophila]|uniref:Acyl-coenzyme A thioesterase THEM4 n=1 Tax=Pseudonocardia thermophila TaxID=1848 RepID=A0A1M6WUX3_PSETH|nr:PaaI family thioesterase [Pseudonocardia thermophila]SHK97523.1 hypothetical protein SAMN05443637_115125 [Pseudonocardia thermophila]
MTILDPADFVLEMPHAPRGTVPAGYAEMIAAVRELEDRITEAAPPAELVADIRRTLTALSSRLAEHAVPESERICGTLLDEPGRGQMLIPPLQVDEVCAEPLPSVRGRVTFGPRHIGGNGAVHGGVIPLLFDDFFGICAHVGRRPLARTAYLRTDYRAVTPVGTELQVLARLDREEGRKRFLVGELRDGERVCAEVTALFVQLKPGQP